MMRINTRLVRLSMKSALHSKLSSSCLKTQVQVFRRLHALACNIFDPPVPSIKPRDHSHDYCRLEMPICSPIDDQPCFGKGYGAILLVHAELLGLDFVRAV